MGEMASLELQPITWNQCNFYLHKFAVVRWSGCCSIFTVDFFGFGGWNGCWQNKKQNKKTKNKKNKQTKLTLKWVLNPHVQSSFEQLCDTVGCTFLVPLWGACFEHTHKITLRWVNGLEFSKHNNFDPVSLEPKNCHAVRNQLIIQSLVNGLNPGVAVVCLVWSPGESSLQRDCCWWLLWVSYCTNNSLSEDYSHPDKPFKVSCELNQFTHVHFLF